MFLPQRQFQNKANKNNMSNRAACNLVVLTFTIDSTSHNPYLGFHCQALPSMFGSPALLVFNLDSEQGSWDLNHVPITTPTMFLVLPSPPPSPPHTCGASTATKPNTTPATTAVTTTSESSTAESQCNSQGQIQCNHTQQACITKASKHNQVHLWVGC